MFGLSRGFRILEAEAGGRGGKRGEGCTDLGMVTYLVRCLDSY